MTVELKQTLRANTLTHLQKINPAAEVAVILFDELINYTAAHPSSDAIVEYLNEYIDQLYLEKSFHTKIIFVYNEVLWPKILIEIHEWFINQPCRLDNIYFVSAFTVGAARWYSQYCHMMNQPSMNFIDVPCYWALLLPQLRNSSLTGSPCIGRDLKYFYDYFGGNKSTSENKFLAAVFHMDRPHGLVEFRGGYGDDLDNMQTYLERITAYSDPDTVKQIIEQIIQGSDCIDPVDYQQIYTEVLEFHKTTGSAINVIRETYNNSPFTVLTEKTLKCFCRQQIPLPLSYYGVKNLESIGFQFNHDLIDYSYQSEPIFYKRILLARKELRTLINKYTLNQLTEYIEQSAVIQHNYTYITSDKFWQDAERSLEKSLSDDI